MTPRIVSSRAVSALAAALGLAGCVGGAPPAGPGAGLVDPATGVLDAASRPDPRLLADPAARRIGRPLTAAEARSLADAARQVLAGPPAAPEAVWGGGTDAASGTVDLIAWRLDGRTGLLCGDLEQRIRPEPGAASLGTETVLCRSPDSGDWSVTAARAPGDA